MEDLNCSIPYFYRGIISQYILEDYMKAEDYYKKSIMLAEMPIHSLKCIINHHIKINNEKKVILGLIHKFEKYFVKSYHDKSDKIINDLKIQINQIMHSRETINHVIVIYKQFNEENIEWKSKSLKLRKILGYDISIMNIFEVSYDDKRNDYNFNFFTPDQYSSEKKACILEAKTYDNLYLLQQKFRGSKPDILETSRIFINKLSYFKFRESLDKNKWSQINIDKLVSALSRKLYGYFESQLKNKHN